MLFILGGSQCRQSFFGMPQETSNNLEPYFDDPRLRMTILGRLAVRIISYLSYLLILAAAFTALFSEIKWLFWFGVLLALFLIDRLLHFREGDRPIFELPKSGRVNAAKALTGAAYSILERSYDKSRLTKRNFFLEVCLELLRSEEVKDGLRRLDVKPEEFRQKTEDLLSQSPKEAVLNKEDRLKQIEILGIEAFRNAEENNHRFVDRGDLFSALPHIKSEAINHLLNTFSLETSDLKQALLFGITKHQLPWFRRFPPVLGGMISGGERRLRHRVMNRAWTSRPTYALDRVSTDLTDLAREGTVGFLIGHELEYKRLVETLSRPINPNALLVGEVGIGKETLVSRLALQIVKDRVPSALFDKRLVALHLSNLVAGAPEAELQQRIKTIVEEIIIAGNIILYIPEIHNLVKTSGTAYISAADALMPIIMNNAFPIIGASYPKEFKQLIEPRSDFAGAFEIIRVEEISEAEAEKILIYESLLLEQKTKVFISFGAVKTAVRLAKRYFRNKFLPRSAEELLKEGVTAVSRREEKFLGPEEIIAVAEEKVNIPIHKAGLAEAEALLHLEERIHGRIIDQEEAVGAVSNALREYRSGLARPGGPIASFLFVGPTGVGKTELSKILAEVQFGSREAMIRFDMTEYQDKQSFYRFIGSPDGAVSGALTDAVLKKPYSLILLDEFEKAFPDILNLFLQVFDDGRLTDNLGRTVDFQNTIIIATSNAHSDIIVEALSHGESVADIAEYLKRKLVDVFRPELLNRFSKIIVFKNLSLDDIKKIAELNLKDLAELTEKQGITLTFDASAVTEIAKLGYDPAYGARPLRRLIDERLKAPLAEKLLKKEFERGGRVKVVFEDGGFKFINISEVG